MGGLAFLPWEDWIARLLHPVAVAIRRWTYISRRRRSLVSSEAWPETQGYIHSINWDSSNPREEIVYSYSTEQGYQAGSSWRWFDRSSRSELRVGDKVILRYKPKNHAESVFLRTVESDRG